MSYCKILLKSSLVLAVFLLGYVLLGVAPASATVTTLDVAVVRGTDNGVYWSAYSSLGVWINWVSLSGSTPSPPGICENANSAALTHGNVVVVVRGTDNGIYLKEWASGLGWSPSWFSPPGGGATKDTPACAYLGDGIYVVVRGTTNELYWNSYKSGVWSGWVDLNGASASVPVLVSTPGLSRLDLFVQGTDNGIYHKAFMSGSWSSSWDSPGGKTLSKPAAALRTVVYGCPSCQEGDDLLLVVRGTDNSIYTNFFSIPLVGHGWAPWYSLSGQTLSAPTFAYYANGCTPGTTSNCNSIDALAVRGMDNAVYHRTFTSSSWSSWDSPGGSITNSPALAFIPVTGLYFVPQFLLLVEGYPSSNLYFNTVTASGSTWGTYSTVDSGATNSDPALVALV